MMMNDECHQMYCTIILNRDQQNSTFLVVLNGDIFEFHWPSNNLLNVIHQNLHHWSSHLHDVEKILKLIWQEIRWSFLVDSLEKLTEIFGNTTENNEHDEDNDEQTHFLTKLMIWSQWNVRVMGNNQTKIYHYVRQSFVLSNKAHLSV